jgi:hypothetical protein
VNHLQYVIGIVWIEAGEKASPREVNDAEILCRALGGPEHQRESEQQDDAGTQKDQVDAVVLGRSTRCRNGKPLLFRGIDGHGISTFTGAAWVPKQEWYRIDYGGVVERI